jgi:hypothetical protein
MAGLVPAIHVLQKEGVDARHKAGHEGVLGGIPMNVRISLSVLVIVAAVIFFFFYTETGRLLLAAMGFAKPS